MPYMMRMIASFRSKSLKLFWTNNDPSKLPVENHDKVRRQLAALDVATDSSQMDFPGWKLHGLQGKPKRWSVWVTGNYRITFGFNGQDADAVDLEDYH